MNNELIGIIEDDGFSVNVTIAGTGEQGEIGKSAYEEWLDLGNVGSEEDFLLSLEGQDGYTPQKGIDYFDGIDGTVTFEELTLEQRVSLKGDKGEKGDTGDTGLKGDQGPKGEQGIQGERGPKGDTGERGLQGIQGEKGDPFVYTDFTPTQLNGLKGDKGDKGDTGQQGIQGIQGIQGEQGERGPKGDTGLKGDTGEQGIQGIQGEKGVDGYTPIKGIDYFDGINGEQGIQGIEGKQGPKGNDGYTPQKGIDYFDGAKGDTGNGLEYTWNGTQLGVRVEGTTQYVYVDLKGPKGDTGDIESLDAQLITDSLGYIPLPISGGVLENYREKLTTLSGTSTAINLSLGNVFNHTLSGNTTYSITNAVNGQSHSFTLIITQTATVRTLTFPASIKWQGGEIPDLTTTSKTYVLTFMTVDGGTTWLGMFGGEF